MEKQLHAQEEPMAPEFNTPERSLEQACAEDGHLLAEDPNGGHYCMRCPHTE